MVGSNCSKTPSSVNKVSLSSPFSWYFPPHLKVDPFFVSILFIFKEYFEKISYPFFGKSSPTIPTGMAEPKMPAAIVA